MNEHLKKQSLKEQEGFMKARGCADATSMLKITLQNLHTADQDAYLLFDDTVKAFDSVNRDILWKILKIWNTTKNDTYNYKVIKMYTDITIKLGIKKAESLFLFPPPELNRETILPPFYSYLLFKPQYTQCTDPGLPKYYQNMKYNTFQMNPMGSSTKDPKRQAPASPTRTPFMLMMLHSSSSQKMTSSEDPSTKRGS